MLIVTCLTNHLHSLLVALDVAHVFALGYLHINLHI